MKTEKYVCDICSNEILELYEFKITVFRRHGSIPNIDSRILHSCESCMSIFQNEIKFTRSQPARGGNSNIINFLKSAFRGIKNEI